MGAGAAAGGAAAAGAAGASGSGSAAAGAGAAGAAGAGAGAAEGAGAGAHGAIPTTPIPTILANNLRFIEPPMPLLHRTTMDDQCRSPTAQNHREAPRAERSPVRLVLGW